MKVLKPNPKAQGVKRAAGGGGYRIVSFPKEFERGILDGIDSRFYLILLSSLILVYTTVIILANTVYSEEELANVIKAKYIQKVYDTTFEEPVIEETEEETLALEEEGTTADQEPEQDARAQRDEGKREEAAGPSAAERRDAARRDAARRASARDAMQQQVAGQGVLGELSAGGEGGSGDAVYDVLGESGSGALGDLDQVLSGVGGLESASSSSRRSSLGERAGSGGRAGTAGIDDLIGSGVGQSGSVSINRDASFAIKGVEGSISGRGSKSTARSQDAIGRVVGKHADAIENCYKKESRINPNLKGSATAQFTISPEGRVTKVRIVKSTLKSRNVENCITRRIKSWRFAKIDKKDGDVQARYKWIFSN
ncbi:MAG: TonB family protein [Calditrichaeota bacterium]|nr:MAG: TonB family protein [Calditrichota bacterium]MBL1206711.1 TonB family protein [Calditrichota bacterium]NOG46537.1 TonB family protein [Calditrichota bacterium]